MKVAVLKAPGNIVVEKRPVPDCPPGGLLLKVEACAICSTDNSMYRRGHRDLIYPRIPGHEIAATIVESRAEGWQTGDRVQLFPGIRCGSCPACRRGHDNRCETIGIIGFNVDGGFCEYMSIDAGRVAYAVNHLPEDISFEEASLIEPLASCLNAQEAIEVGEGDTVLIIGAGPVGLLNARLAVALGAGKVFVAERQPERLELAQRSGVRYLIDVAHSELEAEVYRITGGRGMDVIINACREVGAGAMLSLLAGGGRLCLFSGLKEPVKGRMVEANTIHYRELTIRGAYGSTVGRNKRALKMIAERRVVVGDLITARFGLEAIKQGLEYVESKTGGKAVILN